MSYRVTEIHNGTFAVAVWDDSWESYNNCYLLERGNDTILIDCCKSDQSDQLVSALSDIGAEPENIRALIATHGHSDHIGGSGTFPRSKIPSFLNGLIPA